VSISKQQELIELAQARRDWFVLARKVARKALPMMAFGVLSACLGVYGFWLFATVKGFAVAVPMAQNIWFSTMLAFGVVVAAVPYMLSQMPRYPTLEEMRQVRALQAAYAELKASQSRET
jgi:hypothetical protein